MGARGRRGLSRAEGAPRQERGWGWRGCAGGVGAGLGDGLGLGRVVTRQDGGREDDGAVALRWHGEQGGQSWDRMGAGEVRGLEGGSLLEECGLVRGNRAGGSGVDQSSGRVKARGTRGQS